MAEVQKAQKGLDLNGLNGAARVLAFIGVAGAALVFLQNMAKTDRLQVKVNQEAIQALSLKVDKGETDHANGLERTGQIEVKVEALRAGMTAQQARSDLDWLRLDDKLQKEFEAAAGRYASAADILPRIAVLEEILVWLKRKIEIVPPEGVRMVPAIPE